MSSKYRLPGLMGNRRIHHEVAKCTKVKRKEAAARSEDKVD